MDAVLNWLWQGGVVALAAQVMLFALRRARASTRYSVCWAALLLIVGLFIVPSAPSATLPAGAPLPDESDAIVSLPIAWWTSPQVILAAWLVWASVQLLRFVSAIGAIRRARAGSRAFPSGLESLLPHWRRLCLEGRRAALVLSDSVTSAAVLGWGSPTIAIAPALLDTLDPEDLDRVVVHEWAHVQRRDDAINVVQVLVRVLAGWHPAVWWIDRRLQVEREIACDEMTVAITGSPKSYAQCLVKLAGLKRTPVVMQIAPAVFTPSTLRVRVVEIVSAQRSIAPMWSRALAAAIILALSALAVAVGGLTLVEARAYAQPLVTARTLALGIVSAPPARLADPLPSNTATELPARLAPQSSSQQPANIDQHPAPLPQLPVEPIVHPVSQESIDPPLPSAPVAAPAPGPAAALEVVSAADTPAPPKATDEAPRSPWSAAAAGGAAIGKKSKKASVATAGFFTRVARRVAGSF